jgi:hypothetical protein
VLIFWLDRSFNCIEGANPVINSPRNAELIGGPVRQGTRKWNNLPDL